MVHERQDGTIMPVSDGEHHGTVGVTLKTCLCRDLLVLLVADSAREVSLAMCCNTKPSSQVLLSGDGSELRKPARQRTKLLTWGSPLDKAIYKGSQLGLGILSIRPSLKRSPHGKAFYRLLTAFSVVRALT